MEPGLQPGAGAPKVPQEGMQTGEVEQADDFSRAEKAWFAQGDIDELLPYMSPESKAELKNALGKMMEEGPQGEA